jgi:hypothetical protein
MSGYQELRFYSPTLGAPVTRVSMADAMGREYFATIPRRVSGKTYRANRERALNAIMDAIEECHPGEVIWPSM